MRRRNISILLAVPAANALSLANFQSITSSLIPLDCQLTYDSQIPSCTVSDFNNGCSADCVAGLNDVAIAVSESCDDVRVSSSTLLGIVKNGGIVAALCPKTAKTSAQPTVPPVTVQPSTPAAQPAAVSVTIPTGGSGVTGGLGFKTTSTSTSTSSQTPIPVPQSEISTSTKSTKTTKTTSTTSQTQQAGGLGGETAATKSTTTTAKKTTSTASSETTSSPQSQDKSGGGSPFDTTSNDATRDVGSMLALAVAVFAVVAIGR